MFTPKKTKKIANFMLCKPLLQQGNFYAVIKAVDIN